VNRRKKVKLVPRNNLNQGVGKESYTVVDLDPHEVSEKLLGLFFKQDLDSGGVVIRRG
jgi:hypothetical protein